MIALINAHLLLIPHKKSHYSSSNFLYFDSYNLILKILYFLFRTFYWEKENILVACSLTLKAHYKMFQYTQFAMRKPKTGTCNLCEYKMKLCRNPTNRCICEKISYKQVPRLLSAEKVISVKSPPPDTLVVEFDYAQNRELPKLETSLQFNKRLLWLYNFNVHCHNDGQKTFYTNLEYDEARKNANAVVSYLDHSLSEKGLFNDTTKRYRCVILLSDNCGGRNKNLTMIHLLQWISRKYKLVIDHIFPELGHSFNKCDRNFSL